MTTTHTAPASSPPVGALAQAAPQTEPLAILAFAAALLALWPAAIPLGHVALVKLKKNGRGGRLLAWVALGYAYLVAVLITAVVAVAAVQHFG